MPKNGHRVDKRMAKRMLTVERWREGRPRRRRWSFEVSTVSGGDGISFNGGNRCQCLPFPGVPAPLNAVRPCATEAAQACDFPVDSAQSSAFIGECSRESMYCVLEAR